MKRLFKSGLWLALITLIFFGIRDFCRNQTQGFCLRKTISACQNRSALDLSGQELEDVRAILSQPFHFTSKGFQCFAFVSEDQKYVLKLLNWKPIEPPFWSRFLPVSWTLSLAREKESKKDHDFNSYSIAFNDLKQETGLIYLHLDKTHGLNVPLCLYDPIQIRHLIGADDIEFILQKRADLFLSYFEKNKDDKETLRDFFSHLLTLVQSRMSKQIRDSDISLEHNMGVLEGKPVLFDIGNLSYAAKDPRSSIEILKKETRLVLSWLRANSPELAGYLSQKIELLELHPAPCEPLP